MPLTPTIAALSLAIIGITYFAIQADNPDNQSSASSEPSKTSAPDQEEAPLRSPESNSGRKSEGSDVSIASDTNEAPKTVEIDGVVMDKGWELTAYAITLQYGYKAVHEEQLRNNYLYWKTPDGDSEGVPFSEVVKDSEEWLSENDKQATNAIAQEYDWQIKELLVGANQLLKDALTDYYGGQQYDKYRDDGRPIPPRKSVDASKFWIDGRMSRGGWICLLEFRSENYPTLNDTLAALEDLRERRFIAVRSYITGLK